MGTNTVYNYDSRNRLLSTVSTGGAYTRYSYDNNGNMLSKTSGILEPIKTDELTIGDLPDFGLFIRREHETGTGLGYITLYSYDHYNRLTKTESKETEASYLYNAQGYRVLKTVNDKTIKYLYEVDKVVLETDGSNKQLAFQVYGSSLLYRKVAKSTSMEEQSYYYLYNAHGDVTALIDAEGNIAATYDYDAFGTIISETGNADNYIKYAGYQYDDESGLYYLNARYYDSTIAKFITEDSYRGQRNDPMSLNLYSYCSSNPIRYTDPTGHWQDENHYKEAYNAAYGEFMNYIMTEYYKIKPDKVKDKKTGKVTNDYTARNKWKDEQLEKAKEYAKAFAAGSAYVDNETSIHTRVNFGNDAIFHGITNNKRNLDPDKVAAVSKSTAVTI